MNRTLAILMLEDDPAHAALATHALRSAGVTFSIKRVDTRRDFEHEIKVLPPDLILSDYALPGFDGMTALEISKQKAPGVPFIFVTGTMGEEVAIETLKHGATDYVLKSRLSRLAPAVLRALCETVERRERRLAEQKLRQSNAQLRALTAYLQRVREEERTRIARQVHDELGHALTGLKIDLAWLTNHLPTGSRQLHQKSRAMSAHIDATIQTVRQIATELRPGILDTLGLEAALEWQANEFQTRSGIRCNVLVETDDATWGSATSTVFFRIFQETLTNIIRHAEATRVDVALQLAHDHLVLVVKDDGRGISEAEANNFQSIGLAGMRERAALLGGDITFAGSPGQGTTVTVRIPLSASKATNPGLPCVS